MKRVAATQHANVTAQPPWNTRRFAFSPAGKRWEGDGLPAAVTVAIVASVLAGCDPGAARVSGTVTLDGRPLETGSVQFHPAAAGPVAYGSIDGRGRFSLTVGAGASRLPPGRYTATVVAVATPVVADGGGEVPPQPITPRRYGEIATSGLTFDVMPGANTIILDLVSGPEEKSSP